MASAARGGRSAVSACVDGLDKRETEFLKLMRELMEIDPDAYRRIEILVLSGFYQK